MAGVTWRNVVFDCSDAVRQAEFWAAALGWEVRRRDPEWSVVSDSQEATTHLGFSGVPEPKTVKNRLHLDLLPTEGGSREDERDRLERLGAHLVETVMEDWSHTTSWPTRRATSSACWSPIRRTSADSPERLTRPRRWRPACGSLRW